MHSCNFLLQQFGFHLIFFEFLWFCQKPGCLKGCKIHIPNLETFFRYSGRDCIYHVPGKDRVQTKKCLLCIPTSFWVLHTLEGWTKKISDIFNLFQPFSTFFLLLKHFSTNFCLNSSKNIWKNVFICFYLILDRNSLKNV